eukprot:scaffold2224_cov175-Ochromonas_danica.AAC.7
MSEKKESTSEKKESPPSFIDVSKFSFEKYQELAKMSENDREAALQKAEKHEFTIEEVTRVEPMTFLEELTAVIRYFSYKGIYEERLKNHKPYILVAPPHGVFPFGNIITMMAFPSLAGFSFRGLAASAAVTLPFFKQFLCTVGAIDASRASATKALNQNLTLGISTGGVAEIFETDLSPNGHETIVLKNRKGIVRLAFRTGAGLVPCYLLGNTQLLSLYCGGDENSFIKKSFLRWISRKLGFGAILFWGRFFLPIPYRIPIVGLLGKPIDVPKKEHPTEEEIEFYHNLLLQKMAELFDKYKAKYGWENKELIIS